MKERTVKETARTVIQQCSSAKVKIRPALDGGDAQWAEVGVQSVIISSIVSHLRFETLSGTVDTRCRCSNLPGSVLLVPQDSLLAEPPVRRRIRFRGGCELWRAAQLLSGLASACRELMAASNKCTEAGVKVEQGVYGQKQEMVLKAEEPLTLLLDF
uniref:D-aminoacyl-tRNA deacylase n=1 Tax=Amphiprion percula TaxID=161767 RepID=A0A3P8T5S1_AMPPE